VVNNVLAGDHAVCQGEDGHCALRLTAPNLHPVLLQIKKTTGTPFLTTAVRLIEHYYRTVALYRYESLKTNSKINKYYAEKGTF
jgi:hypothetical protein